MPSNDCCGRPQLGYEAGHSVLVDRETERISTHIRETWPSSRNHDLWQRPSHPPGPFASSFLAPFLLCGSPSKCSSDMLSETEASDTHEVCGREGTDRKNYRP